MNALYTYEDHTITELDFINALWSIGIHAGNKIFVHSDIKAFGKIATRDKTTLLRSLVNALQESVGHEGTVVMPTFSYSFCKNEVYNKGSTRSTVGALTDFFRTEKDVQRSLHPIFSVAAWGKHADDFMRIGKDSFGKNTVFERLRELDAKIVFLGVTLQTCTFLHHVEQMHNVPHRFMKVFEGSIIDGEAKYHDAYTFFVRPLDGTIETDFSVIEPRLRNAGLLNETTVGGGRILCVSANQLYDEGMHMLDRDPYCFVTRPVG
jgi:aminoglycoside 3-N-acetyltransferase